MNPTDPQRPAQIPEYVEACFENLAARGLGHAISVGGGLGLLHYLDYRPTYDVDAWWSAAVTGEERRQVVALLVASKMVALVERGAPRDFRDVHAICQAELITPRECWALWARRQLAAGNDADPARARLAVETHLARIEQHRRLDQIAEPEQRGEAERVRAWFGQEFLNAVE